VENWNQTKMLPDNSRFVILVLQDGSEVKAKWDEAESSLFRTGKQWVDRNGKFRATNINPAIDWREI